MRRLRSTPVDKPCLPGPSLVSLNPGRVRGGPWKSGTLRTVPGRLHLVSPAVERAGTPREIGANWHCVLK